MNVKSPFKIFLQISCVILCSLCWRSGLLMAQQPEAIISNLHGEVFVSFQGKSQLPAVDGGASA